MSGLDDIEDVFEGWLERPTDDQGKTKGWLKKSFAKKWKKGFYVLRKYISADQAFLQWFDKEEHWRRQMAKGTLDLYPKYKVFKRADYKGKQHVFEVSTDSDTYILAAESETIMDLWAIQLQMQTRLNPRVAGKMFHVRGKSNRQMQRIGAKDQQCLLHISKWGVTLALERSHAVLSQWPLTTVRTYESLDCNEFNLEAGRASPMGQGKYTFLTQPGEDNQIFDTIDQFAASRIQGRSGHAVPAELTEDDVARAYDELRFSIQIPASGDGGGLGWQGSQSAPRSINGRAGETEYDHLDRSDSIGSARSLGSFSGSASTAFSYNRIERLPSWGSQGTDTYDKLNLSLPGRGQGNYDRLDLSPSVPSQRAFFPAQQPSSVGAVRDLPDIPLPPRHRLAEPRRTPMSPTSETGPRRTPMSPTSETGPSRTPMSPTSEIGIATPFGPMDIGEFNEDEGPPPALPPRAKNRLKEHEYDRLKEEPNSGTRRQCEPGFLVATVETGSPNFTYLNTAYSSSVEVLPALYATVDKSKKSRGKKKEVGRRSKSYESICGSPKDSPMQAVSTVAEKATSDGTRSPELISPRTPQSERVAMALQNSLSDEGSSFSGLGDLREVRHSAGTSPAVTTLDRMVSQLPHPISRPRMELADDFSNVNLSSA